MDAMGKNRLEAFSDGVLAIIITIMVLELKVPHGVDFAALKPVLPVFLSYVLELRLRGDLLEQPSSPAALGHTGQWRHPVGQPQLAVLVIAVPLYDGLDR